MARQNLTEAGAHTEILERNSDGSMLIQIITPGWGSSGYYSADVLQEAAKDKVWPKGTKMFFDHPSASEAADRPERSVKDLAATLSEDARWDGGRLVGRADPCGLGSTVFADKAFREAVACSVRASAEMNIGEAEGKKGWIVEKIHPGTFNSVDFVTYAGRGGMILEAARRHLDEAVSDKAWSDFSQSDYDDAQWKRACLIDTGDGEGKQRYKLPVKEPSGALNRNAVHAAAGRLGQTDVSADVKKKAAKKLVSLYRNQLDEDPPKALLSAAGMSEAAVADARLTVFEASARDTDRALQDAVSGAYSDTENDTYAWMRDYDPDKSVAYFEVNVGGKCATYQQAYSESDGEYTLTGDRTEVNIRTQYVPVGESRSVELTREAALKQVREARNVGQWMESRIHLGFTQVADEMFGNGRLTREERITLSSGIGDALAAFTTAVEKAAPQLYQRDLWDDPEARTAVAETATPNVPRHAPGQPTTIRENTMPENEGATTPIEESKRRELEEKAGRVDIAEAKLASETERADKAEQALAVETAKEYARDFATKRVREANSELSAPVVERIAAEAMREIPLTEAEKAADRRLDTEAFGKRVDEARKEQEIYLATVIENSGATVRGLGPVGEKQEVTAADSQRAIDEAFGRQSKEG
jgi:hypothetical protein